MQNSAFIFNGLGSMHFIFEQIRSGGDRNFGYLIGDGKSKVCALVDPSYKPEYFVERAKAQNLKVNYILNTHGHHDHTNGNQTTQELTHAPIGIYHNSSVPHDIGLTDGQTINLGNIKIQVIHTPGHCPDHVVFYLPQYKVALTGDHLFVGKVGGTTNDEDAKLQFDSLQKILTNLPEETTVWSGHDVGCRPVSTLSLEKMCNPFLTNNFEDFLHMKKNWPAYKKEHGLI